MVTGFDIWGHDAGLRRHWKLRFLAFAYDIVLTIVPTVIVLYLLDIHDIQFYGIYSSFVFYLASSVCEAALGASPGKVLFGLQVHAMNEKGLAFKAFARNINRLFWFVLPPLDLALGMATTGDPRQRLLDRVAGTKVVHIEEKKKHQAHMEELANAQAPEVESPKAAEEAPKESNKCRDCGGKLIMLPDEKLQCQECGRIQ